MKTVCAIFAVLAFTATAVSGQLQTTPLQPFTSISICTPFNVLIQPSTGGAYALLVDADPTVMPAINASVVGTTLTLSTMGGAPTTPTFTAPNPIKVAIQLPADQLASVAVSSTPQISVAVAAGFKVPVFSGTSMGTSALSVINIAATKVQLVNGGTGSLYVSGTIGDAQVTSSGTGSVYVLGVSGTAAVDASGITKVYIGGADTTQISGQVGGISSVIYDKGVCMMTSQYGGIFGSPCTQSPITAPPTLTAPSWSCALTVSGFFGCSTSGAGSSSSFSSGNGGSSVSSSSSGTGMSTSSTTVNGVTTTSTNTGGMDGTSQLVTDTGSLQVGTCTAAPAALVMLPA